VTAPPPGWVDPNPLAVNDRRTTTTTLTVAGLALTGVVIATLVATVMLTTTGGSAPAPAPARSVTLTAAGAPVEHSFMPSVAVATGAPPAASPADGPATRLPYAPSRGVRVTEGTRPGLYGGTNLVDSCDAAATATFLQNHPQPGRAWASAIGIAPDQIPAYLNTLTAVLLTTDTWVTSHGFADGRVTTFQTVLQAGNAVMIDPAGVPRMHCASGNPLAPPTNRPLSDFAQDGTAWPGFAPANVVVIDYSAPGAPATPATGFDLVDAATNAPLHRQAGGTIDLGTAPSTPPLPDPFTMNVPDETPR
jgi:hypothetical protein